MSDRGLPYLLFLSVATDRRLYRRFPTQRGSALDHNWAVIVRLHLHTCVSRLETFAAVPPALAATVSRSGAGDVPTDR
jgi:hypothetical protein